MSDAARVAPEILENKTFKNCTFHNLGSVLTPTLPVTAYATDGAIGKGVVVAKLTKETAGAYTLAAPTPEEEGITLTIVSQTAAAHVVTATGLLNDGVTGGAKDTATFAAFPGAAITLMAINEEWAVISSNAVTVAASGA